MSRCGDDWFNMCRCGATCLWAEPCSEGAGQISGADQDQETIEPQADLQPVSSTLQSDCRTPVDCVHGRTKVSGAL